MITGLGLITLPVSAGIACTTSLASKVFHEIIVTKYHKNKKQYEKDDQRIEKFYKLYKKSLQDNKIV